MPGSRTTKRRSGAPLSAYPALLPLDQPQYLVGRWGADTPVTIDLTKQPRKECPISLQNHGDDTWFRNIGFAAWRG